MSIFTHVTVGCDDLDRARRFYDHVLEPLGLKRLRDFERGSGWGAEKPQYFIIRPLSDDPATAGNGATYCFSAASPGIVDEFHKRVLALGGRDEGAPGPRAFAADAYAAYARDLDGHKIAAICYGG